MLGHVVALSYSKSTCACKLHLLVLLHKELRIWIVNLVSPLIIGWHHTVALIYLHTVSLSSHRLLESTLVVLLLLVGGIRILVLASGCSVELSLRLGHLHLHISVNCLLLSTCVDLSSTSKTWEIIGTEVGRTLSTSEDLIQVLHFL